MFFEFIVVDTIARGFILSAFALFWIVLLIRINGLRSLSKMTSFDFVMTVALGSLVAGASQTTEWQDFAQVLAAMAGLFFVQWATARIRKASDKFEDAMQNRPTLLMRNGAICEDALRETRVARSDLVAKLREANVLDFSQVRAVVLETTGDVSVLHGDKLEERLIEGVRSV
ncbi:MAG: DUF421 domain-containing protein [Qipengyuania sp.]